MKKLSFYSKIIAVISLCSSVVAISTSFREHCCNNCHEAHAEEHIHTYGGWQTDCDGHWKQCTKSGCDHKKDAHLHTFSLYMDTGCTTDGGSPIWDIRCSVCKYIEYGVSISGCPMNHNIEYVADGDLHYERCKVCGTTSEKCDHALKDVQVECVNNDCTQGCYTSKKCSDCGYQYAEKTLVSGTSAHTSSAKYKYNETNHWRECAVVGCNQTVDLATHYCPDGIQGNEYYHFKYCYTCNNQFWIEDHDFQHIEYKNVTLGTCEDGYYDIQRCSVCNYEIRMPYEELFTHEADNSEWKYDTDGHWHACTNDGCNEKIDYEDHDFIIEADTCQRIYTETKTCKICGYVTASMKVGYGDHDYIRHDKVEATPDHDGCKLHYECSRCHKLFIKRIDNYTEVTQEQLVIKYVAPVEPKKQALSLKAILISSAVAGSIVLVGVVVLIVGHTKKSKKEDK